MYVCACVSLRTRPDGAIAVLRRKRIYYEKIMVEWKHIIERRRRPFRERSDVDPSSGLYEWKKCTYEYIYTYTFTK